jgi:large subunit ribosomal protein L17
MRHLNKGRSLSRSTSHRKALLQNLAQELFQRKRIRTTLAKAKELRPFAEKLVTTAKKDSIAARRRVLRFLSRKAVVKSLFESIAPSFAERNGGYTRIIKLGQRIGDAAPQAIIELVGFEGVIKAAEDAKAKKETTTASKTKGGSAVAKAAAKASAKTKAEKKSKSATPKEKKQKAAPRKAPTKAGGKSGRTGGE